MTFPAGAHLKRTNFSRITAAERDEIIAALKLRPEAAEEIAFVFRRGRSTIEKIGKLAGIWRGQR